MFSEGIQDNFRFMVIEVGNQIDDTISILIEPSDKLIHKVRNRDNYIDNFKTVIQKKTFRLIRQTQDMPKSTANVVQAISIITDNLERIADYCTNIADQTKYLSDIEFFHRFDIERFFKAIVPAMGKIEPALFSQDVDMALEICKAEFDLDDLYAMHFQTILRGLRSGRNTQNYVTSLLIIRYLERMGDCLQNIGEAIISATVGEKLKIHQYQAMEKSLQVLPGKMKESESPELGSISFESIGETKSGSRIGRVNEGSGDKQRWVIFKEGQINKIIEERDSMERWEKLAPGLVPKIYDFQEKDDSGSLLLEYLEGTTLQEIIVDQDRQSMNRALGALQELIASIWVMTRSDRVIPANFMGQLRSRLPGVFRVHPRFNEPWASIGSLEVPSLEMLLDEMMKIESQIQPVFSVFIHGDFNTDNILYNKVTNSINFIDLHRSRDLDYVQDVSVFLLSNFRFPTFDERLRLRLNNVSLDFYRFALDFARSQSDDTFNARLALGLVRSFITSTRFVLSSEFAKTMFLRARYLMERLLSHGNKPWQEFPFPEDVLIY